VGTWELQLHGQDRCLADPELDLFAVFDGVGGVSGSERASEHAARGLPRLCRSLPGPPLERLAQALSVLSSEIAARRLGATTATALWLVGEVGWWISVGDSRLYLLREQRLVQLSRDQGEGNLLDSALGFPEPDALLTRQRGRLGLRGGDRLALVTDGVTGDFPPDILGREELAAALSSPSAQLAAEALVRAARKLDDRTALVVDWVRSTDEPGPAPAPGGVPGPPSPGWGGAPPGSP
jgi:serine/threonine protein phosphatase PrpC